MTQVVAVISGKGGTGKTSVCAGVAACLASMGQRVLCIDADVGLRNLDISLGMSNEPAIPFTAVMRGEYPLSKAASHPDLPNLWLLTAPVLDTIQESDLELFGAMIKDARSEGWDWVFIDAPAGLGTGFRLATQFADEAVVVACGDPASLRDAGRATDVLLAQREIPAKLVVNRVDPKLFSQMRATIDDVMDGVGLPLLGYVPEDANVILAAAAGRALMHHSRRGAALAYGNLANRLCGRKTPLLRL